MHAHDRSFICNTSSTYRKSTDGDFRNVEETDIVGDLTNDDSGLLGLSVHVSDQTTKGHGRAVDTGHIHSLQDNLVELGISTTGQETVQLRREKERDRERRNDKNDRMM